MATKLKNLKIRKVDFVDEGANPDADIRLKKRREGEERPVGVERKNTGSIFKKLFGFLGKAAGMAQDEIDRAVEEIQKEASMSFHEKINEANQRKIAEEIWETCYALQSSFCSILYDEELDRDGAEAVLKESLREFSELVQGAIASWAGGRTANIIRKREEVSDEELETMRFTVERLNETMKKARKYAEPEEKFKGYGKAGGEEKQRGDVEEMKIDKSKLTDAERAFLESIEKRCGVEDAASAGGRADTAAGQTAESVAGNPATAENAVSQAAAKSRAGTTGAPPQAEPGDIYKGLHPAVAEELEELKKFREASEEKELSEIAKKYAIIGRKEEELIPLFKSLKAAGGTAYQDMIAVLDQTAAAVEKSGVFSELGRTGHGSAEGGAWAEAEAKAAELLKSRTGLSKAQALDEVLTVNPELAARCEKED